jgi:hypothetical protein
MIGWLKLVGVDLVLLKDPYPGILLRPRELP